MKLLRLSSEKRIVLEAWVVVQLFSIPQIIDVTAYTVTEFTISILERQIFITMPVRLGNWARSPPLHFSHQNWSVCVIHVEHFGHLPKCHNDDGCSKPIMLTCNSKEEKNHNCQESNAPVHLHVPPNRKLEKLLMRLDHWLYSKHDTAPIIKLRKISWCLLFHIDRVYLSTTMVY